MTEGTKATRDHPFAAEIEAERRGWYEVAELVRSLTPEECVEPGYYGDPSWTVRDLVAHLGTWLAEAQVQLEQINAGTYEGHDPSISMSPSGPSPSRSRWRFPSSSCLGDGRGLQPRGEQRRMVAVEP